MEDLAALDLEWPDVDLNFGFALDLTHATYSAKGAQVICGVLGDSQWLQLQNLQQRVPREPCFECVVMPHELGPRRVHWPRCGKPIPMSGHASDATSPIF